MLTTTFPGGVPTLSNGSLISVTVCVTCGVNVCAFQLDP
jgi:hypothetical protein